MSIRLSNEVWETKLRSTEKVVLAVLCNHADDTTHEAWPSVERLATKTSLRRETVSRVLRALAAKGFIRRQSRGRAGRKSVYVVFPSLLNVTHDHVERDFHALALKEGETSWKRHMKRKEESAPRRPRGQRFEKAWNALMRTCQLKPEVVSARTARAVRQLVSKLARELGLSDEELAGEINEFQTYWRVFDFRGRQGEPPTVGQVGDAWGRFEQQRPELSSYLKSFGYRYGCKTAQQEPSATPPMDVREM